MSIFKAVPAAAANRSEAAPGTANTGHTGTTGANPATGVPDTGRRAITATGNLELDHVTFGYGPDAGYALHNVSVTALPGEDIAITGPPGAGKTTLAKLLIRQHDVTAGSIRLDGIDTRDMTLDSLRRNMSLLPQETPVFPASIYATIADGRPDAAGDDVYAAARTADVDAFIADLPDGYHTRGDDPGQPLSDGQRKHIAIARAVVQDAPILVVDEPTAGLDADTSRAVLNALQRLMDRRTTIIITHDERTLALADRAVHMNRGGQVTSGSL